MQFFRNKYLIIFLCITVVLIVIISFSAANAYRTGVAENGTGIVITSVSKVFQSIGDGVSSFFKYFGDKKHLAEENKRLTDEYADMQNQLRKYESYKVENENLRSLLDLKQNITDHETVAAEVVSKDASNWFNIFVVDKGTAHGIQPKMSVVSHGGLVGHVVDAGANWAKISSIINADVSVSGMNTRTGDICIVSGDVELENQGLCKMIYINKDADLEVGDIIETSGLGGLYPKGLVIGTVKEKRIDVNSIDQSAVIEPAVDFTKIREVLVIEYLTE